jgi:uncharacterized protein (DUF1800 family)
MGVHPDLMSELESTDAVIARALDLAVAPPPTPLAMDPPTSYDGQPVGEIVTIIGWWFEQMRSNPRLIEERLVWFWHDHFATSLAKVRVPYLMHQQHLTVRTHATGSFSELLHAMAKDAAMLMYLDGMSNRAQNVNENFGRECLELFTMGIGGGYTQSDVVEASRAFTGWVVNVQGRPYSTRLAALGVPAWGSVLIPQRHDSGEKELLGRRGAFDLDNALDVILEHPATGRFIATKLYHELVGLDPDDADAKRLGDAFARDWSIMGLVEAIVNERAFTSSAAVRARVRTPVEKLVGIAHASGLEPSSSASPAGAAAGPRRRGGNPIGAALRTIGYVPFVPPNVGGFPEGPSLLGPHQLVHTFDLLQVLDAAPELDDASVDGVLARFGLFDVEPATRRVLERASDPGRRFALAAMSPEFAVT